MRRADLSALAVAILVLGSAAVAGVHSAQDQRRVTLCANNLSQLYKMQINYMVQFGGRAKLMPLETGDAFWLKLSLTSPPLIDPTLKDIYQCPVENFEDEGCDYRGPSANVNTYGDGDVVGADVDGNHGETRGGNVIRKSGDVITVAATDPLWIQASTKTTGGSKANYRPPAEETPRQKQALVDLGHLAIAVMLYREFQGEDPRSLRDLVEKPEGAKFWPEGGYLRGGKLPRDPWGFDYRFEPGEREPKVWCTGADGKQGGEGENADLTIQDIFKGRGAGAGRAAGAGGSMAANERNAAATLKTFATAQADFRSNDRDGNRVQDFWTGDIWGLYAICPSLDGVKPNPKIQDSEAIKLIEPAAAAADAAPVDNPSALKKPDKPRPKAGYLFRVLEVDEHGQAYGKDTDGSKTAWRNYAKFAACAYPAEHGKTGKMTFLINEDNTIWQKDTGGEPVKRMPESPAADGWKKVD